MQPCAALDNFTRIYSHFTYFMPSETVPRISTPGAQSERTIVTKYYLRKYVHLGLPPDAAILLDGRSGTYLGLNGHQAAALRKVVHGWPEPANDDSVLASAPDTPSVEPLLAQLVAAQLLTDDAAAGRIPGPLSLGEVVDSLVQWDATAKPAVRLHHVASLSFSCARAYCALKWNSIGTTLQAVQTRKLSRVQSRDGVDWVKLRGMVRVFVELRPWFYSHHDRCLFDSLVLIEFLAIYRIFPMWILGVKNAPFAAHSWVQQGPYVLNGPPESAREFTPIVII